ncbi:hypothetical protein BU17DRAFT_88812 [Hysterangium stoloniferum]|nr:hypothetical protein BU17DRAFT_88812 [Hysterangium stoloniferum]
MYRPRTQQGHRSGGGLGRRQVQPQEQQLVLQTQPLQQGVSILYLPHLLYSSTLEHLKADKKPTGWPREFPFPNPASGPVPAMLRCIELYAAALKTDPSSHTETGKGVMKLSKKLQLAFIKRVNMLCDYLVEYSKPDGNVPWPIRNQRRPDIVPQQFNSWKVGSLYGEGAPNLQQQADAINRLSSWFEWHHQRQPPEMTSEPSVQDEVFTQLLNPLSLLMQTRYNNKNDNNIDRIFYPQWGRSCAARAGNKAAIPDFVLNGTPVAGSQCVVLEVKTWWGYNFNELFTKTTAAPNRNAVAPAPEPSDGGRRTE